MPSSAFRASDFEVFELRGFQPRMAAIRARIRPKLETLGATVAGTLEKTTASPVHTHVAKHARRTVHPPDDTWVAFGPDPRGYKKHPHFKVALSRHCVRFLFEIGPEYADKKRWASTWKKNAPKLGPVLARVKELAWFRNEHDETPAATLADLGPEGLAALADELTRTRDGQIVLGRVVSAEDAAKWRDVQYRDAALATFRALAPLYRLR